MKRINCIVICLLLMFTANAEAQLNSSQEVATPELVSKREAQKKEVLATYMSLKEHLILSDSLNASTAAAKFVTALDQFKFKKLTLPDMNAATILRKEIKELALEISKTKKINSQRKALSELSAKMWTLAPKLKPMQAAIYQQICPMTGDTWLSMDKEIKNPYFPKNMLTCGEVKQSI